MRLRRKRRFQAQEFQGGSGKQACLSRFAEIVERFDQFSRLRLAQRKRIIGPQRDSLRADSFQEQPQQILVVDERIDVKLAEVVLRPVRVLDGTQIGPALEAVANSAERADERAAAA